MEGFPFITSSAVLVSSNVGKANLGALLDGEVPLSYLIKVGVFLQQSFEALYISFQVYRLFHTAVS